MSGGLDQIKLGSKTQRQSSASEGVASRNNVKMHPRNTHDKNGNRLERAQPTLDNSIPGGKVTLPPNPEKAESAARGCKHRHTRGK